MAKKTITHEQYIARVMAHALRQKSVTAADRKALKACRLTYGAGPDGTMGITYHNRWQRNGKGGVGAFVGICGTCQPNGNFLLADTVLHELGHVCAGPGKGHGPEWKEACDRLGLVEARATYMPGQKPLFSAAMMKLLKNTKDPNEGKPVWRVPTGTNGPVEPPKIRPCSAGDGVRGGKSRGPGSGSRNVAHVCECEPPRIIRAAVSQKPLRAKCLDCGAPFVVRDAAE